MAAREVHPVILNKAPKPGVTRVASEDGDTAVELHPVTLGRVTRSGRPVDADAMAMASGGGELDLEVEELLEEPGASGDEPSSGDDSGDDNEPAAPAPDEGGKEPPAAPPAEPGTAPTEPNGEPAAAPKACFGCAAPGESVTLESTPVDLGDGHGISDVDLCAACREQLRVETGAPDDTPVAEDESTKPPSQRKKKAPAPD